MVLGAALPGLVFLMVQKTWAQYGPPPQPSIWAVPGAVVPKGSDVTIFCRIPPGVTSVRLTRLVPVVEGHDVTPQGAQEVFEFSLKNITHNNAGIYFCEYFRRGEWSRSSDNLELVVTGIYNEKPFLAADVGPQEILERNMTLLCHTHTSFDSFILCRGGNASFPQNCSRQDHNPFLIAPVRPGHRRTYRCFGSHKHSSYLWSLPSDPLEFSIPGVYNEKPFLTADSGPQGISERNVTLLCHTHPSFDSFILCRGGSASFPQSCSRQDHSTFLISPVSPGNKRTYRCFGSHKHSSYLWSLPSDPLEFSIPPPSSHIVVWASIAAVCFLLFLLLFICLYWLCAKHRATNGENRRQVKYKRASPAMDMEEKHKYGDLEGILPEDCRKVDTQVSAAEGTQEVTYAHLCQEVLTENMKPLPSSTIQDTSTQTCVYASLTLSKQESQS